MEPTTKDQPQSPNATAVKKAAASATSDSGQKIVDKVSDAAHAVREQIEDRGAEIISEAKQKISEVYDQTNRRVIEQYEKAVDYSRENPGKTTLIAFGVGVGVGFLLLSSFSGSRSRRNRVVEPVMNALTTLAREMFG